MAAPVGLFYRAHAEVDWSNPLTSGLQACYLPDTGGASRIRNLGLLGPAADMACTTAGAYAVRRTTLGLEVARNNGISSSIAMKTGSFAPGTAAPKPQGSMFFLGTFYQPSEGGSTPRALRWHDVSDNLDMFLMTCVSVQGGYAAIINVNDAWHNTGFPSPSITSVGAHSLGGSFDTAGNCFAYVDGRRVGSNAYSGSLVVGAENTIDLDPFNAPGVGMALGCIWNRQLSDAEFAALAANPWQILKPVRRGILPGHRLAWTRYWLHPTRRYTLLAPATRYAALAPPLRYTALQPPLSYVALIPGNAMPALRDLPPIDATVQTQTIAIDFGQFLPSGVTLTGTPTVTIAVHGSGVDPDPNSRLSGAPQIGTVPAAQGGSSVTNAAILQQLQNLLGGVTYVIEAYCPRSDGDVASGWTHVAGVTPT